MLIVIGKYKNKVGNFYVVCQTRPKSIFRISNKAYFRLITKQYGT